MYCRWGATIAAAEKHANTAKVPRKATVMMFGSMYATESRTGPKLDPKRAACARVSPSRLFKFSGVAGVEYTNERVTAAPMTVKKWPCGGTKDD
jgi:hypothetical protein